MLTAYATCLKRLDRKEDYIRVVLELLAKVASSQMRSTSRRRGDPLPDVDPSKSTRFGMWSGDEDCSTSAYLDDLQTFAKELPYEVTVPMTRVFGDIQVSPYPRHHEDGDGFSLEVLLRHLLEGSIEVQHLKLRLVGTLHGHKREVWLSSKESFTMRRGAMKVWVETNVRAETSGLNGSF